MEIITKGGRKLTLEIKKWQISKNRKCKIIDEPEDQILLRNENQLESRISKQLLEANHLIPKEGYIELSQGLYEQHFVNPERRRSREKFNRLFEENMDLIFKNQELVLTKAEYYLLSPDVLCSGGAYIGGFQYTLGGLFESMKSGKHIYLEEIGEHKKMYLVNIKGSPLSGTYTSMFWSEAEKCMVSFNSKDKNLLVDGFLDTLKRMSRLMMSFKDRKMHFEDVAFENFINELKKQ